MNYLCRNGHLVKQAFQAGLDCAKCRANERRRAPPPAPKAPAKGPA